MAPSTPYARSAFGPLHRVCPSLLTEAEPQPRLRATLRVPTDRLSGPACQRRLASHRMMVLAGGVLHDCCSKQSAARRGIVAMAEDSRQLQKPSAFVDLVLSGRLGGCPVYRGQFRHSLMEITFQHPPTRLVPDRKRLAVAICVTVK